MIFCHSVYISDCTLRFEAMGESSCDLIDVAIVIVPRLPPFTPPAVLPSRPIIFSQSCLLRASRKALEAVALARSKAVEEYNPWWGLGFVKLPNKAIPINSTQVFPFTPLPPVTHHLTSLPPSIYIAFSTSVLPSSLAILQSYERRSANTYPSCLDHNITLACSTPYRMRFLSKSWRLCQTSLHFSTSPKLFHSRGISTKLTTAMQVSECRIHESSSSQHPVQSYRHKDANYKSLDSRSQLEYSRLGELLRLRRLLCH